MAQPRRQIRTQPPPGQAGGGARGPRRPVFSSIDLGTNNCRLLSATPTAGGFQVLDSFSRTVRLGEGLHRTGRLSHEAMERAIGSLKICATRARRWDADESQPPRLRAIATEACRQAENGAAFVAAARAETGLPLEIISPREEAALAMESCAGLLTAGGGRRAILLDIGGGSTEVGWMRLVPGGLPEMIGFTSIPIGVVTLTEYCNGACDGAGFSSVVEAVAALLRPFEAVHRIAEEIRQGGVVMVGASGTVTTLASISLGLPRYRRGLVDGHVMPREAVAAALGTARGLGRDGLARHPCIGAERAEFVLPGCAIYAAVHELWQVPALTVADRGLREGMLMRLIRANAAGRAAAGRR